MPVSKNPFTGYLKYSLLFACLLLTAACVKQGLDECPPPGPGPEDDIRQLLYLRVSDGPTRADISRTAELEDIMVYLFDRDEKLVDTVPYTSSMIRDGVPIDITDKGLSGGYASVWANLGNAVETDEVAIGDDIDSLEIRMLPNIDRSDYYTCPGDIFFGYKRVAFQPIDEITEADTVWIERKNSRLHITVKGLTGHDASDYYFRIGAIYTAYNFEGTPQLETRNIWELGEFDEHNDFVSPEPYEMIHNDPAHIYTKTSRVSVGIYKSGDGDADKLVASTDMDTLGGYIKLERGKTSNVLIVLDEATGEVTIQTVVTPWNEIHQWTKW